MYGSHRLDVSSKRKRNSGASCMKWCVPLKENVVIGGDFSGHVGEGNRSDHEVLGR